jgi:hypothetical protein
MCSWQCPYMNRALRSAALALGQSGHPTCFSTSANIASKGLGFRRLDGILGLGVGDQHRAADPLLSFAEPSLSVLGAAIYRS